MSLALEAVSLTHAYGPVRALDGVSLTVPEGALVAVVGESGSGKSTLLRCFNRLVAPQLGVVRVEGADVRELSAVALRRRVGYVPQHGGLLPHWTALRNVALVPQLTHMDDPAAVGREALELVGLPPGSFGQRFAHELSGGQRQRVALARALAARQSLVLLDEPFGALDAISRAELQQVFDHVRRERAFSGLLITHDLATAARLADRIVVMRNGRVEQDATLETLRSAPATPYVQQLLQKATSAARALLDGANA